MRKTRPGQANFGLATAVYHGLQRRVIRSFFGVRRQQARRIDY
jgi:hypothetical protein